MKKLIISTMALGLALAFSGPSYAAGQKNGYQTTTVNTTGGSGKLNTNSSPTSYTTTTTSGPKGQLQTGGTTNVSSSKTGPGKSMP